MGYYGGKSTAEFASGEVAWLLNGSSDTDPAWYQAIDVDAYPTLEQSPYTIVHIDADTTSHAVIYDINGQRLAEPRQGLNIVNGKKTILR